VPVLSALEPGRDCPLCPRLVAFREHWRMAQPGWHNAPVADFGPADARLLIVGLAPGLRGANRTGRPFTGDHAGGMLYRTLLEFGFASGTYDARPDDGLKLVDARIANAVRCVPPENKPTPAEIVTCRRFLVATIEAMPRLGAILALGRIAHDSVLPALGLAKAARPFSHGAVFEIRQGLTLHDSYHCSRQNTNTGRLTQEMFSSVFARIRSYVETLPSAAR
jgi:uracil-DNA glycosylase family 4